VPLVWSYSSVASLINKIEMKNVSKRLLVFAFLNFLDCIHDDM